MSTVFEEIKERTDLVELVGRSLELKKIGSNYRGLCPFHQEKTPSFYVRPETNRFHCFGCERTGDCFDWVIEHDQVSLRDALVLLAGLTGVKLEDDDSKYREKRVLSVLAQAQRFFEDQFRTPKARIARDYLLDDRGLQAKTIYSFGLGYAPISVSISSYLMNHGYEIQEIVDAGLVTSHSVGSSNFFFERITIPIRNVSGDIVGFGGRSLRENSRSKYINSRETSVFHKQNILYGFHQAKTSISMTRQAVVVEGYLDVIQAHQHGFTNVVATLGTSISDSHLRQLSRVAGDIVLALDADNAGQSATWRSLQKAEETLRGAATASVGPRRSMRETVPTHTSQIRVMSLPQGLDPDSCIRSRDHNWPTLVDKAKPVVDFAIDYVQKRHDLDTPEGREAAASEIADTLVWVSNPVARAGYYQKVADLLDVDESDIRELVRRRGFVQRDERVDPDDRRNASEWDTYTLALLSITGQTASDIKFTSTESRALAAWSDNHKDNGAKTPSDLHALSVQVSRQIMTLQAFPLPNLLQELRRAKHVLHRKHLFAKRSDLLSILRSTDDATERAALLRSYAGVSRAIMNSDAQITLLGASG